LKGSMKVLLNKDRFGKDRIPVYAELIKENKSTVVVRIGDKYILRKKKRDVIGGLGMSEGTFL